MEVVIKILFLAILGFTLFMLFRPKAVFVLKIRNGKVRVIKGRVPRGFIEDCQQLVSENNLRRGTIRAVKMSGRVSLRFSYSIPKRNHQQFRNAYRFHI
jgi:hypothetical protein